MSNTLYALPSLKLAWRDENTASYPLRLQVPAEVRADVNAEASGLGGNGVFPAFSAAEDGVFDLAGPKSKRNLSRLLSETVPKRDLALQFLKQLAVALDHLHEHGVIHGFLRVENLLVDSKTQIILPDWFLRWELAKPEDLAANLPCLSPEFLRQERLTPATDQFLLGCIAYRLIYGAKPFDAHNASEQILRLIYGIWGENPPIEKDIGIADVWDRVFSLQPEWRFATCEAFVIGLQDAITASESSQADAAFMDASPALPPSPRHAGAIWAAAAVLVVACLGLGGWSASLARQTSIQNQQIQDSDDGDATSAASLKNGILSVCNSTAVPIQITSMAAVYRGSTAMQSFNSSDHPAAKWIIAPASRQSLSFAEKNQIVWDGSALFYYIGYQNGDNIYVSTGIWTQPEGQCLDLGGK